HQHRRPDYARDAARAHQRRLRPHAQGRVDPLRRDLLKHAPSTVPAEDVLAGLGTDARRGLTGEEARARLARHGRNELVAEQPAPLWRKFLAQFQDTLVALLLVATAISVVLWLLERDAA